MSTPYQTDIIAWANEQAAFIRMGKFDQLDLEHLAEEIEDVGKSEQRELKNRMAVLLAHLLKWQYQPERQGRSWVNTVKEQRKGIKLALDDTPSLKPKLTDQKWLEGVWSDTLAQAYKETDVEILPESCPWRMDDVLKDGWLPA